MNSAEIASAIVRDPVLHSVCIGVFPADRLPVVKKYPSCFIANADPASQPGSHWVAFYIPNKDTCEFFDTYGGYTRNEYFKTYINKFENDVVSAKRLQSPFSTVCGQHALYFLFNRCRGLTFTQIVNMYSSDTLANNETICQFINDTFVLTEPISDLVFLVSQTSQKFHP